MEKVKVAVFDDNPACREVLMLLPDSRDDMECVGA
jgi:hypothetical protein